MGPLMMEPTNDCPLNNTDKDGDKNGITLSMNANHTEFDEKQRTLIDSWSKRAQDFERQKDYYSAFMSLWIAFNAFCYALYHTEATKPRADIDKPERQSEITDATDRKASISSKSGKTTIKISGDTQLPAVKTIKILIEEKYTEDRVFSAFAKAFEKEFLPRKADSLFAEAIKNLVTALKHNLESGVTRSYVVNMAKSDQYSPEAEVKEYEEQITKNIVFPLECDCNLKQLIKVLYQVRCNIFHGEKTPGVVNDDRIVKAAYYPLASVMQMARETNKKQHH